VGIVRGIKKRKQMNELKEETKMLQEQVRQDHEEIERLKRNQPPPYQPPQQQPPPMQQKPPMKH